MGIIYNQRQLFSQPVEDFSAWKGKNPDWEKDLDVVPETGGHPDYHRIRVQWKERIKAKTITHKYAPAVNMKTGEVYLDCRKRKIFAKFSTFIFVRPLHTLGLTLYHGLGIGVAREIFKTMRGKQSVKEGLKNSGRSIADIVRTPVYGLALSVIDVTAVIFAAIKPNSLYKFREISGKLEMALHRTTNGWKLPFLAMLAPCFTPMKTLSRYENSTIAKKKIKWFSKGAVEFRREENAPYNDFFRKFPADKGFISAAYEEPTSK